MKLFPTFEVRKVLQLRSSIHKQETHETSHSIIHFGLMMASLLTMKAYMSPLLTYIAIRKECINV